MSNFTNFCLAILCLLTLSNCTISHEYGPYMGKVVDKETGEPIEGAVVFVRFFTETIGPRSEYVDALEVLTDEKGEFEIPPYRINKFRILHLWDDRCSVIIFKPGFGVYPGHKDVTPRLKPGGSLPEDQSVTIKLPKLKTIEERKENLGNIPNIDAPSEKFNQLRQLEKNETKFCYNR